MKKKALIDLIYHAGNISIENVGFSMHGNNNTLLLLTAAGQISGTPLTKDESDPSNQEIVDALFLSAADSYDGICDDCPAILLKDATLTVGNGQNISYRYLYVFTNDIIAATVADLNNK